LAVQRKISGFFFKSFASRYLVLLGIAQTCKFQEKSFLKFLLSGEMDVDHFRPSPEFPTAFYLNSFPAKEFVQFRAAFCSQNLFGMLLTMPARTQILWVCRANHEPFT